MSHRLFGVDPGSWNRDIDMGGETVECAMYCPPEVTPEQLDVAASLFESATDLDARARAALTAAANTEDVRLYFEDHEDQLNTPASIQDLSFDASGTVSSIAMES